DNFTNEFSARTKFVLTPTGTTTITLSADYDHIASASGLSRNPYPGAVLAQGFTRVAGFQNIALDNNPYNKAEQWGSYVKVNQDLGVARLVSITSIRRVTDDF